MLNLCYKSCLVIEALLYKQIQQTTFGYGVFDHTSLNIELDVMLTNID